MTASSFRPARADGDPAAQAVVRRHHRREATRPELEEELDEIEEGKLEWTKALRDFSGKFNRDLDRARQRDDEGQARPASRPTKSARTAASPMVIKFGRFGEFLACSNYPECKTTQEIGRATPPTAAEGEEQIVCDKCGKPMQLKRSRFGQFYACTGYPDCKNTKDPAPAEGATSRPSRSRPARTAARRWCSRAAATVRSTPAPATPTARPSARSAAGKRRRPSRPA